jgi:hypothetical protein
MDALGLLDATGLTAVMAKMAPTELMAELVVVDWMD